MKLIITLTFLILLACDNPTGFNTTGEPEPEVPQNAEIRGVVLFYTESVFDAKIDLIGGDTIISTSSDNKGQFTFQNVANGFYTLKASHSGLNILNYPIQISSGQNYGITLQASEKVNIISDSFGLLWDFNIRTATSWENAKNICNTLGGRLPTISELHRNNSLSGTNDLVTEGEDKQLWSIIPWDKTNNTTVKMKDGTILPNLNNANFSYRCVYPIHDESSFSSFINTNPNNEDFTIKLNGTNFIIDSYDRPPLPYFVAVREAAFVHGWIPGFTGLAEAVSLGLPNGSKQPIMTNEFTFVAGTGALGKVLNLSWEKSQGLGSTFDTGKTCSNDLISKPLGFRIMGFKQALGKINPQIIVGSPTMQSLANSLIDSPLAGHIPFLKEVFLSHEKNEDFGTELTRWSADFGTSNVFTYKLKASDGLSSISLGTSAPSYNVSPFKTTDLAASSHIQYSATSFSGPNNVVTQSFTIKQPDGSETKMWVDKNDRPSKPFSLAIKEAAQLGAMIPTRRDYLEMLYMGLAQGSDLTLYTSDFVSSSDIGGIRWKNKIDNASFETAMQFIIKDFDFDGNIHPYRLMWTNEVRLP